MTSTTTTTIDTNHRCHVVVIGGGAAGLSAAITLGRALRSVVVVDAGSPRNAPADGVHGFLSRDGMSPTSALVAELEHTGLTVVVVSLENVAAGVISLHDAVRIESARAITHLAEITGRTPLLLSGDNNRAATLVAKKTGIADVRSELLSADKAAAVDELARNGRMVMVVGDGVNDAPAMATAHTGIAMGRNGSDLTLDTADAVLIRDDLSALPNLLRLSQRAHRIVVANLTIAATFIITLVAWDLAATLPLPLGVAGHESSTVIVALNGMRMLSQRVWSADTRPVPRLRRRNP